MAHCEPNATAHGTRVKTDGNIFPKNTENSPRAEEAEKTVQSIDSGQEFYREGALSTERMSLIERALKLSDASRIEGALLEVYADIIKEKK